MLNEGCGGGVHPERWRLSCIYLDHDILGLTVVGHDELLECLQIAIRMGTDKRDRVYVNWNFEDKELTITKGWLGASFYEPNVIIPYFEPDLAQYDKLIKKLRTYLIFS
jgi:hypothetical protein